MSAQHLIGKIVAAGAVACTLSMPFDAAVAESLVTAGPETFDASGVAIAGWTWLRSPGDYAEWTWSHVEGRPRHACVDFSLLVTNAKDGGSGYDGRIKVYLVQPDMRAVPATLSLKNPFRPVVASNTNGVGYQAYGALCLPKLSAAAAGGFSIRMEWKESGRGHVAVRKDGAVLAYTQ